MSLWLGMSTPSDEDQSSEEQPDLLESLAAKGVPKSSKTKDVYQKFVNILDARPYIQESGTYSKTKRRSTGASKAGGSYSEICCEEPVYQLRSLSGL